MRRPRGERGRGGEAGRRCEERFLLGRPRRGGRGGKGLWAAGALVSSLPAAPRWPAGVADPFSIGQAPGERVLASAAPLGTPPCPPGAAVLCSAARGEGVARPGGREGFLAGCPGRAPPARPVSGRVFPSFPPLARCAPSLRLGASCTPATCAVLWGALLLLALTAGGTRSWRKVPQGGRQAGGKAETACSFFPFPPSTFQCCRFRRLPSFLSGSCCGGMGCPMFRPAGGERYLGPAGFKNRS